MRLNFPYSISLAAAFEQVAGGSSFPATLTVGYLDLLLRTQFWFSSPWSQLHHFSLCCLKFIARHKAWLLQFCIRKQSALYPGILIAASIYPLSLVVKLMALFATLSLSTSTTWFLNHPTEGSIPSSICKLRGRSVSFMIMFHLWAD